MPSTFIHTVYGTTLALTLDDGQEDDDDKEEEGDVKQDAVELVGVSSWVLQLVSDTTSSSHAHVHVEQIALPREENRRVTQS